MAIVYILSMFISRRHIRAIGRTLALFLLVANSGFTLVLHSCMIEMSCCDGSMATSTLGHAGTGAATLARPGAQCCAVTVAGGVSSNPIVTDRTTSTVTQKPCVPGESAHQPSGAGLISRASSRFPSHATHRVEPPSVEKYVLNASLLI